jgi:scyllo-inositol 2-dehydrogenase (NADP+)
MTPGIPTLGGYSVPDESRTRPRRVAIIGYGLAGSIFHAPFIRATPGLELAAVVTRDPERKAQARAEYPGVEVFETADAIWTQQTPIDVAVIAAPNRAHVPLAYEAVQAGMAVVIDKPISVYSAHARSLVDEARRRGVLLTVFQNRRWDGDFQTLRQLVGDGAIGKPVRFESRFERWRTEPRPGWRESGAPEDAGGLLVDLGAHLIDQALLLFGPVSSVYAELDMRRPNVVVDDDAFVALTHESGVRSHLWMSVLASQVGPRFRVLGTKASYVKFGLDGQEDALRSGVRPGSVSWGEEPESRWGTLGTDAERTAVPTLAGDYGGFYRGLAAALETGAPAPVDPDDSVRALEVIEAARASSVERRTVSMLG